MASMALVGCQKSTGRQCVDWDGKVVVDALCSDSQRTPVPGTSGAYYHWFYFGGSRLGFSSGSRPGFSSGSPRETGNSGAQSGVSRGGFGSSAGAHGAGE
jgi:hypothetical protein